MTLKWSRIVKLKGKAGLDQIDFSDLIDFQETLGAAISEGQ